MIQDRREEIDVNLCGGSGRWSLWLRFKIRDNTGRCTGTGNRMAIWNLDGECGRIAFNWAMSVILSRYADNPALAAFFITGFLGGFTTFSSFMNETMQYMMSGLWLEAFCYLGIELGCGLFMVFAGIMIARTIF